MRVIHPIRWAKEMLLAVPRVVYFVAIGFYLILTGIGWSVIANLMSQADTGANYLGLVCLVAWLAISLAMLLATAAVYKKKGTSR